MTGNKEMDVIEKKVYLSIKKDNKFIANINDNIKTDVIIISKDKLENILLKDFNDIWQRPDWKTPLSIFLTIIISVVSSDFKDCFLSKEVFQFIFYFVIISSGILTLNNYIRTKIKSRKNSIQELINKIANIEKDR